METLSNGYTLHIYDSCFPLSTDSMVLADFVKLPRHAHILDLGSGCGTLGVLLCARDAECQVVGVEIDPTAHSAAWENIGLNNLDGRMQSICADLRLHRQHITPGSFECCVSNPPYFQGGPASKGLVCARREDLCSLDDLLTAAAWALKFGGDFFVVYRPERLAELFATAVRTGLEPKRLCLVRHRAGDAVSLVLVQCRKGAKPGLKWEELCLRDAAGQPTPRYREIYHL